MNMIIRRSAPVPCNNADYHRARATRERELATLADDPSVMRAHAVLADLHEAEADGGRNLRVVV